MFWFDLRSGYASESAKKQETPEHPTEPGFGAHEALHCLSISWVGGRSLPSLLGGVSSGDHRFEGLAFVGQKSLGGFD
jgi:hypothetical protein